MLLVLLSRWNWCLFGLFFTVEQNSCWNKAEWISVVRKTKGFLVSPNELFSLTKWYFQVLLLFRVCFVPLLKRACICLVGFPSGCELPRGGLQLQQPWAVVKHACLISTDPLSKPEIYKDVKLELALELRALPFLSRRKSAALPWASAPIPHHLLDCTISVACPLPTPDCCYNLLVVFSPVEKRCSAYLCTSTLSWRRSAIMLAGEQLSLRGLRVMASDMFFHRNRHGADS